MKKTKNQPMKKSAFAEFLGVSRGRISQLVKAGLPVLKGGLIDRDQGGRWYRANIVRPATLPETAPADAEQVTPAANGRAAAPTALTAARTRREQLAGDLLIEEIELRRKRRVLPGDAGVIAGRLWLAYWETVQGSSLHITDQILALVEAKQPGLNKFGWIEIHEIVQNTVRYRARGIRAICDGLDRLGGTDGLPAATEESVITLAKTESTEEFISLAEFEKFMATCVEGARDILLQIPARVPRETANAVSAEVHRAITRLSEWKVSAPEKESDLDAKSRGLEVRTEVRTEKPGGEKTT